MASMNDFQGDPTQDVAIQVEHGLSPTAIHQHSFGHPDLEEFTNLTNLSSEFHVIDRSSLPFRSVQEDGIRQFCGFPPECQRDYSFVRGNYVAGSVIRGLRKQAKGNTNRFPDLTMVFDLPTELIQEIFERLHPIDLYNVIRSSKGLRSFLLSRSTSGIWSGAFARHPEIPSCPFDISFPKWVSLLFGPSTCDNCGSPAAMVDFSLRKRQCRSCLDAELRYSEGFEDLQDKLGNQYEILWTLVQPNHRYASMAYPSESAITFEGRYSNLEVEERAREIQGFLSAIKDNIPNAEEDYNTFKTETVALVRDKIKHVETCNKWCSAIYDEIEVTFMKTLVPLWFEKWKKYLAASGQDPRDIANVEVDLIQILLAYPLYKCSKKGFRSFTPVIGELLSIGKARRIAQERQEIIDARKMEVGTLYSAYHRTLDPMTWQHLPALHDICLMAAISDYIYSDDASQIFPAEVIAENIRQYVDKWLDYGRCQLSRAMAEYHMPEPNKAMDKDMLDLAAATFICPLHGPSIRRLNTSSVIIGWEDAALHLHCIVPHNPKHLFKSVGHTPGIIYSVAAYNTVKHLLQLLDLDPDTTLASDLDILKARFMCTSCPWDCRRRTRGHYAITLKECVSHVLMYPNHTPQSFGLLSEEFTASILFHENSFSQEGDLSWCCRHCSEHSQAPTTRKAVISHLEEIHSIAYPVARTDFFFCRQVDQPQRRNKYFVELDPPRFYACHRCPDAKKARLRTLEGLLVHLGNIHGILNPVQNMDWIQLGLFKDPSQASNLSGDWIAFHGGAELQTFS